MDLQSLFKLIVSNNLVACIRGMYYAVRYGRSSCRTMVFHQLRITPRYIKLERGVRLWKKSRIECVCVGNQNIKPLLWIRQNVNIEQNCHITCGNSIIIGERTSITANVTITDIRHPYEDIATAVKYQPYTTTPVRIGADCHIANGAVILPGTVIGNHCVVGANAVVKGCFPDFTIIAGNPAKVIKYYNVTTKRWEKCNVSNDVHIM